MTEHTPTPKLVMGHIVCFSLNDEEGTAPSDEAVIHLAGDEDSEIEVRCPDAPRLATLIVKAVNNHEALVEALKFTVECLEGHSFSKGIDPRTATPASAIGQARGVLSRVERGEQP